MPLLYLMCGAQKKKTDRMKHVIHFIDPFSSCLNTNAGIEWTKIERTSAEKTQQIEEILAMKRMRRNEYEKIRNKKKP